MKNWGLSDLEEMVRWEVAAVMRLREKRNNPAWGEMMGREGAIWNVFLANAVQSYAHQTSMQFTLTPIIRDVYFIVARIHTFTRMSFSPSKSGFPLTHFSFSQSCFFRDRASSRITSLLWPLTKVCFRRFDESWSPFLNDVVLKTARFTDVCPEGERLFGMIS